MHLAAHLPYGDLFSAPQHLVHVKKKRKRNPNRVGGGEEECGCVEVAGEGGRFVPLGAGFLCACRDLSAAIYLTSPQQIRQEISTQPDD